jgi:hypothetical protein
MYSHVYRHKHLNTPENTLMQKLCKKCILSQGHIDVPLQGLKIVRVSAGDQHMGALTKEGKAGLLRCNKEVMPLCLRNFTWCLKSSCFVHHFLCLVQLYTWGYNDFGQLGLCLSSV